jgi:hypothetical protein
VSVVSIEEARPHLVGPAFCLECRHRWVAVAPVGSTVLECPACGCFKGGRLAMVQRAGPHWVCNCENALFFIRQGGDIYCANCGADQVFP